MTTHQRILAFRTDASPIIGGGHASRCLALAQAAAALGSRCGFFVGKECLSSVPKLADSDLDVTVLSDEEIALDGGMSALLKNASQADWIVVDDYRLSAEQEGLARRSGARVLAIDDLARPHDCDIVLDQTLGRQDSDYRDTGRLHCRRLLGPQFALLDERFSAYRDRALARRKGPHGLGRIVVSFGLSDVAGATLAALDGIAASGVPAEVVVIVGAFDKRLEAIRQKAAQMPQVCTVKTDVSDMATEWLEADLAIGAAGVSSWERCCLGLPALVAVTAENQRLSADALSQTGAILVLGEQCADRSQEIEEALRTIYLNFDLAVAMSNAAQDICDGQGARRVAQILHTYEEAPTHV